MADNLKFVFQPQHLLQSPLWQSDLLGADEQIIHHTFKDGANTIGHVVIRKKKIRFSSFNYLKATFGPFIDYGNNHHIRMALHEIKELARQHKSIYVEINPFTSLDIQMALLDNQFKKFDNYIYDTTILIDLSKGEEEIFSEFERRGQKAIRQSVSRGISVKEVEINLHTFDVFYNLYLATCRRTNFIPVDRDILKRQLLYFSSHNLMKLFFAYDNELVVGALVLYVNGNSVATMYQGNDYTPEIINKRASNALYWDTIKWARSNGYKWFDFGGFTPSERSENEKKMGILNFKQQFGGFVVSFPGNYRYVNKPILNLLLSVLLPVYSRFALFRKKGEMK